MRERLELARQQIVYNWPYYGPRIIGGILVLVILVFGYLFWRGTRNQSQIARDINRLPLAATPTPAPLGGTEQPESKVAIGATPTPTPTATDSADQLPETGFPLVFAIPALAGAAAAGLKLARFKK